MNKTISNILKGFGAGASISLGSIIYILCVAFVPNGKILGSILFSIGLTLVCFLSFNLYTGKVGFLFSTDKKKEYSISLLLMLITNVLVCFLIGFLFRLCVQNNKQIVSAMDSIFSKKTNLDPVSYFISSFFCGIFVYLAVFSYKKFKSNVIKLIGIVISVSLFVLMGFDQKCLKNYLVVYCCYSRRHLDYNFS